MTREEAREELTMLDKRFITFSPVERRAIHIAIKALEQDPTPKNDLGFDCISRAEAIKCLECAFDITGKENMKTVVNYINSAHDKIVNLPRAKQEPKTGHWIGDKYNYRCNVCGQDLLDIAHSIDYISFMGM